MVLTAVIFVSLQVGGIIYKIKDNDYRNRYLPVVEFVQAVELSPKLIFSSAEMAFGLGFDRVVDDLRLGYVTGKKPDVVIIGKTYRRLFETLKTAEPEAYRHVVETLAQNCRLAREDNFYQIYQCSKL